MMLLSVLLISATAVLEISAQSTCSDIDVSSSDWPAGTRWETVPSISGAYCYIYSATPATWDSANSRCQSLAGGDLVSLDLNGEGPAIYNYWKTQNTAGEGYWIGLTNLRSSGLGRWTDYTRLRSNALNWQAEQPSPNHDEDCAYVVGEGDSDAAGQKWKATTCDDVLKPFFCERKLRI